MIRTLQDHGIHQGIDVSHGDAPSSRCSRTATACVGAFGYDRERGRFRAVPRQGRGAGDRRHRARRIKITSNSWEYTGDGHSLAYHAGADAASTWSSSSSIRPAWSGRPACSGILVTEGVRGEGGVLRNNEGRAVHVRRYSRRITKLRPPTTKRKAGAIRRAIRTRAGPPELLTRDHVARCIRREVKAGPRQPARRRFPRHLLDQREDSERGGAYQEEAAQHVSPVQAARRHRHHQGADGGRPDHALHDGRRAGGRRHRRCRRSRACSPRANARAGLHGANRLGGNSLSDLLVFGKRAGEFAAKFAKEQRRGQGQSRDQVEEAARRALWSRSSAAPRARIRSRFSTNCRRRCRIWWASSAREEKWSARSTRSRSLKARAAKAGIAGNREYNPGWHTALDLRQSADRFRVIARAAIERKESRGAHFRDDYPEKSDRLGQVQHPRDEGPDGELKVEREPVKPMPDEQKRSSRRTNEASRK